MTQQETEELLAAKVDGLFGLETALALRAPHWAHSGLFAPGRRMVVWTARQIEIVCRMPVGARRVFTLTRRPPQSGACLDGNRIVCDAPGLYIITAEFCGWTRSVEIVAAPPALLDRIGVVGALYDRVIVLRNILNDPQCTAANIIASIEGSKPCFGLDGGLFGTSNAINLGNYGR